jgi:hypothetical protein
LGCAPVPFAGINFFARQPFGSPDRQKQTRAAIARRMLAPPERNTRGGNKTMVASTHQLGFRRLASTAAILTAVLAIAIATRGNAQEYATLPLGQLNGRPVTNWNSLPLSDESKEVVGMLAGTTPLAEGPFNKFFNEAVFPLFAQWQDIKVTGGKTVSPFVDGPGATSPAKMRGNFKREYAQKATNATREKLNAVTVAKMDEIASGNFHPICRANAMMMIASLDGDGDTAWKKAMPALMRGITSPTTIDAVRVPALAGLIRQARTGTGIDQDTQLQVIAAMLNILKQKLAPGQSTDGPDWIARRAIDILAAMGNPGQNGAVPNALMALVDDKSTSMSVRTAAAAALAKVRYTPPQSFNAKPWIDSLSKLAVECYKTELSAGAAQRAPIVPDRLKAQLTEVRQGMAGADGNGGVLALAAAADKNAVKAIVTQLDNLIQQCNIVASPNVAPTQYTQDGGVYVALPPDPQKDLIDHLEKAGADLEGVIQRGGAAAPAAPAPANGKAATPVREVKPADLPFN